MSTEQVSNVRLRAGVSKQPTQKDDLATESSTPASSGGMVVNGQPAMPSSPSRRPSFSQRAISQTLTGTANLANLLPTGTLLAFQILMPIFTRNGACDSATRPMTLVLLLLLAISCCLASFTDSVKASDGQVYYGFVTFKGMYLFDSPDPTGLGLPDLTTYKIRLIDWVHAVLSVLVFGAVALRDRNVVSCFYPSPEKEIKEVLDIVPVGIGLICSLLGCTCLTIPTRPGRVCQT
ncbi:hypothetical protein SLEP1_g40779 [Rubroshorea leprosula]|uniref:Uncharacterized protein n=1 Tax=Rubroshorea leprosula TaxID=152421 RepID=A0AAV5L4H6_9ROSI|nr:hypothetical protein SLEP1_g40779 [Rubroshorea leprosula]